MTAVLIGERCDEVLVKIEQVDEAADRMLEEVTAAVQAWKEARDVWLGPGAVRDASNIATVLDYLLARLEVIRAGALPPGEDSAEGRAWSVVLPAAS